MIWLGQRKEEKNERRTAFATKSGILNNTVSSNVPHGSYYAVLSQTIKTGIKSVQFVHNLKVPAFATCL